MKIEMWPIGKPKPYGKNPRNNAKAIDPVAESIKTFGFRQPIVVDEKGVIIVGHTRLLAAQKLGLKDVPVHVAKMSKTEAKAYRIADNRLNEIAKWEMGSLSDEIKELKGLNFDITKLGFKEIELKGMIERDEAEIERENAVPEKVKETVKPGDVWVLGDHRLVCGDSSNPETWDKLLGKRKADMVWTDPPYNHASDDTGFAKNVSKAHQDLMNSEWDKNFKYSDYQGLISGYSSDDCAFYVCASWHTAGSIWEWMAGEMKTHGYVVWHKPNPMPSLSKRHWTWASEIICYGTRGKHIFNSQDGHHSPNVLSINKSSDGSHPTQKPVELVEKCVLHSSNPGMVVMDPFCGSGTTIIAAEKTGRKGYGIELSPRYASVIVKRWEEYTGRKAKLEV